MRCRRFPSAVAIVLLLAQNGCDTVAPKPAVVVIATAPSSSAETMVPLALQPVVALVDGLGNPVAAEGVEVSAVVTQGDGMVVAGGRATTDAAGVARFEKLALGAVTADGGAIVLGFVSDGLSPATVNIELTCAVRTISLGDVIEDAIAMGDCVRRDGTTIGSRYKQYEAEVPNGVRAIRVTDSSAAFPAVVLVRGPNEPSQFLGRRGGGGGGGAGSGVDIKVLTPPGVQRILVTSDDSAGLGDFKLSVGEAAEDEPSVCAMHFHSPLSTTQTLSAQCSAQYFSFVLPPGAVVDAAVTSTAFRPVVSLITDSPPPNLPSGIGVNTVSFSWKNSGARSASYSIYVRGFADTGSGPYSVQATITSGSP